MRRLLTATAALAAAATSLLAAPAAHAAPASAAADCTPTITMGKPYQEAGGMVYFPASYTLCGSSKVTIKARDRDDPAIAGSGSSVTSEPSGTTYYGTCVADGKVHRWAAYATIKTPTGGTLLVKSATVYLKAKPVAGNCR